jgi:hypothetical protein
MFHGQLIYGNTVNATHINFIQLSKNSTANNVTKARVSAQVKELTQESFDSFIYSAVTNATVGIVFILLFSYFRVKFKHVYYPRFTHSYSGKQSKYILLLYHVYINSC